MILFLMKLENVRECSSCVPLVVHSFAFRLRADVQNLHATLPTPLPRSGRRCAIRVRRLRGTQAMPTRQHRVRGCGGEFYIERDALFACRACEATKEQFVIVPEAAIIG
mgnify:CR=1 FL=1